MLLEDRLIHFIKWLDEKGVKLEKDFERVRSFEVKDLVNEYVES